MSKRTLKRKIIYTDSDRCLKCSKFVTNNQNGICCDICDHWFHLKCSSLSKHTLSLLKTKNETWMCKFCHSSTFPFHNLDNYNFIKHATKESTSNSTITNNTLQNFNKNCSICKKKVLQPKLSIPCHNCKTFIHKKCTFFNKKTIHTPNKWMCPHCIDNAFPFTKLNDHEFFEFQYNSNFDCLCTKSPLRNLAQEILPRIVPTYDTQHLNLNPNEIHSNSDPSNTISLNSDFGYYDIHNFHKKTKLLPKTNFSIFHTNIQFLNCNFDKLEYLLYSLDFVFDIVCLSETWNPKTKQNFSPGVLLGYQPYHGNSGTTIKSGCCIYVSSKLKFIPRTDLDISFRDEFEEFQTTWIEVINKTKPNALIGVFYRHPHKQKHSNFDLYL